MHSWSWQKEFLTCNLLSPWPHGFFTKIHAPKLPNDLHQYLALTGHAYHAKQVHGDRLIITKEIDPNASLPEADGILATKEILGSVWVCSADCVPILIGDRVSGTVAAVHAGWRGTAAGILKNTIEQFLACGSEIHNLCIALGPAISGEVYQVEEDVAKQVAATINLTKGISPDHKPGHCRLDLRTVQHQQLIEVNLQPSQIAIAPYCTLQTPEHFFSYRRRVLTEPNATSRNAQVQWSGIATADLNA